MKRKPCSYGWTDHAYNRQRKYIIGDELRNLPLEHKRWIARHKRTISRYNSLLFRKPINEPAILF